MFRFLAFLIHNNQDLQFKEIFSIYKELWNFEIDYALQIKKKNKWIIDKTYI